MKSQTLAAVRAVVGLPFISAAIFVKTFNSYPNYFFYIYLAKQFMTIFWLIEFINILITFN